MPHGSFGDLDLLLADLGIELQVGVPVGARLTSQLALGGPGPNACAWLEGSYGERYPSIGRNAEGMHRLFRQFSFPGGVPSHLAPQTPGSFHEGGELGYSLLHAYGAAFDDPDLTVFCVVGDGEAETGPLAASWHVNKHGPTATWACLAGR